MGLHRTFVLSLLACSAPPHHATLPPVLAAPKATILVGDMHGTREIPAFVGQLVSDLTANHPVVLALEILAEETPSIDAPRDKMLQDAWWHFAQQDGRRSVAMADLIETARAHHVTIERFDARPADEHQERDGLMANNVLALRAKYPDATLVVYAGNLHTMRKPPALRPGYDFMAVRLARAGLSFVTLAPRYGEGTAWVCTDGVAEHCGPRMQIGPSDQRGIHIEPVQDGNFDGWFGLGTITASPPAAYPELATGLDQKLAALRTGPEAARARADRAASDGKFDRCAAEYAKVPEPTADDAYNHACCLAHLNKIDAAFERLDYAVAHGFADFAHAAVDPDLAALHGDQRWPLKPSAK